MNKLPTSVRTLPPVVLAPFSPEHQQALEAEVAAGRVFLVEVEGGYIAYAPYGDGCALPVTFEYGNTTGTGPFNWWMTVQVMDGRPRCVDLKLSAAGPGEHLLAQSLRDFPFGAMIEEAVLMMAVEIGPDGRPGSRLGEGRTPEEAGRFRAKVEREFRKRNRGERTSGRVTSSKLQRTAEIYVANLSTGRPVDAVAEQLHVSRSTAGRYVTRSRKAGFLSPATGPGKAGGGLVTQHPTEGSSDG